MLDERWGPVEQALADGLRGLLAKACDSAAVRAAEADTSGRNDAVEQALDDFGLWDLPASPGLLAAAAWELGRALAPVPYPERATGAALGFPGAVYVERGWAPAGADPITVGAGAGGSDVLVRTVAGRPRRSAAGDVLAPVEATGEVVGTTADVDRARRLLRLLVAARAVGAAEGALALAVAHANTRQQFGRPIGAFQAIAHRLADAACAVDGAGLAVRKAAWVADPAQGGDGAPDATFATIARFAAQEAAETTVAAAHQVMGGYGFTLEEDCQLYSRRTRAWRLRLDPIGPELAELARRLLRPAERDAVRWLWHHDAGLPLPRWAAEADAVEADG